MLTGAGAPQKKSRGSPSGAPVAWITPRDVALPDRGNAPSPLARALELGAGFLALAASLPVLWAVGSAIRIRLGYPGDLEWMEGATLVSAMRVRDGLPIYGEPTPEYIPFIYPPLYAALVGGLAHLFPLGYTLGRSVSVIFALVASAALVFGSRREGANWPLALASVGLFWMSWDDSGTFYDLCRTDSLSIALVSWSVVLLPVGGRALVASAVLLAVAFTAKQHAALLGIPMLVWVWRTHGRREALRFAAWSAGPALLFLLAMTAATGGRFFAWLVLVPAVHGQDPERLFPIAQTEVWKALPITTTVALAAPFWFWRRTYWVGIAATILVVVSIMRGHTGGFLNVLIPAFWMVSLLPAIASGAVGTPLARAVAGGLVALQLVTWQTNPSKLWERLSVGQSPIAAWTDAQKPMTALIPTDKDTENVLELVELIRGLDGRVLIPHAPWYAVLAGKDPSFALICLWDIDYKHGHYQRAADRIDKAIANDFDYAIVPDTKLGRGLKENYTRARELKVPATVTRAGWTVRLREVWRHNPRPEAETAP